MTSEKQISTQSKSKEAVSKDKKVKIITKYFSNEYSHLEIRDNSLLVMNNFVPDKYEEALKICKYFYIELGRPIKQFETVLSKSRIPIIFEFVIKRMEYEHYKIIRLETGNIEEIVLGTIVCKNGIITRITWNQDYSVEDELDKYDAIGSIWRIRSKFENTAELNIKNAENAIRSLLGMSVSINCDISSQYNTNRIDIKVKMTNNAYIYTMILNEKTRMYELITISLA